MLKNVTKSLADKGITLEVTGEAKDMLGEKGYDPTYGARPLRRVIQSEIEDKLSESILRGDFKTGDHIKVDIEAAAGEGEQDNTEARRITIRAVEKEPVAGRSKSK
jgi:ATP-dependent Clp protease ATP-binding subunit ClpA